MIKTALEFKTLGELLREKREEKSLTHEQISEIIKINPQYLKSLENGDYHLFPSEVYVKGFLKNYSKFLGIEPEKAIALYRREKEKGNEESLIKTKKTIKNKSFDFSLSRNKIIASFAILLIILSLVFFGTSISDIFKEPELSLKEPVAVSVGQKGTFTTDESSIKLEGSAEIGSILKINGLEYRVNSFEQFSVDYDLLEGNNEIKLSLTNQFGKTSQVAISILRNKISSITPTPPSEDTPPEGQMNVEIFITTEGAYIEAIVDGELKSSDVYPVDEKLNFQAKESFELFAPRQNALSLTINGNIQEINSTRTKFIIQEGKVSKINL